MAHHRKIRGIFFYPMEVGHTTNRRVRLLMNDLGSDGYWIWKCIIDQAYGLYGYYFPATADDIEIIAADVCRKPPELVLSTINACVKRGLFDHTVYSNFAVLTNDKMQLNFIRGTWERRRKGATVYIEEGYFLIHDTDVVTIGDKYSDKIVFRESGKTLSDIIVTGDGNDLFSGVKHNISGVKRNISGGVTPEKSSFTTQDRDRDRDTNTNTGNTIVLPSADVAPNPIVSTKSIDSDIVADLAKKNAGKKKKIAAKKKGNNPDAEPYWILLRRKWVDFNRVHLHFDVEPIPKGDYSSMHRIIEKLRERAVGQAVPWTEQEAVVRWEKFLSTAYAHDQWLKKHFELKNLEGQMQTIFKICENGKHHASVVGKTIEFDKP